MTWILASTLIAVLGAGSLFIRRRLIITEVSGPSMSPSYQDGDRLLALRRLARSPLAPGQVVVFRNPRPVGVPGSSSGPWLIKRVVAVAGDRVPRTVPATGVALVPPGHVVVLGDNPDQSLDSRHLGFIPTGNVVATVLRRFGGRP
ncbi:S26 family signal peptidase [Micromonospora sp. NPDC007230]|uniref:S26 family signal peptidase n=1 Tax=Micromonospora sp. NPDC007230 TaxID=3364237 RepID=UPI0036C3FD39